MTDPSKRQSYQHHAAGLTPEERRLAQRLDALGESDRASAPTGLEERVFRASVGQLPAPKPLGGAALFRSRSWHGWVAIAACFLIATGIGWFSMNPSGGSTTGPTGNGSSIALAELEAEVGFTLDALIASYEVEVASSDTTAGSDDSAEADPFWGSAADDDFLTGFETEVSL